MLPRRMDARESAIPHPTVPVVPGQETNTISSRAVSWGAHFLGAGKNGGRRLTKRKPSYSQSNLSKL